MSNKTLQGLTLSLSTDEVIDVLLKTLGHEDPDKFLDCAFCGKDDWQLRSYPEDLDRPMLVAQPIPFSKNLACWYFPISCKNCGYTVYFDAQTVAENFKPKEDNE